jgi:hypothetical protein
MCGKTTDGRDNTDEFASDELATGALNVRFRINYARVLEDLCAPPKSCVEEALERMTAQGGERVVCRMPGEWRDRGPMGC